MTTERQESSSLEVTSGPENVSSTTSGSENVVIPITGHKLTDQNYLQWSKSVMMFVCRKDKDDYLTGAVTAPPFEDPKYKIWKAENNMVLSWLINSMTNNIGEDFMFYETAKEIWDAAEETYSDKENTSELFEVKGILNDLNRRWQHIDLFDENKLGCTKYSQKYKKIVGKEHVFKFLFGLNKNLDEVRG
ncbi:hypothetical protein AAG906_017904 [Vitis piasezkii]